MPKQKGPIRVVHFGLGPIGAASCGRSPRARDSRSSAPSTSIPAKVGRDLGDIAGVGRALKVKVSDDAQKTIKAAKPDVVVLCTQLVAEEGARRRSRRSSS